MSWVPAWVALVASSPLRIRWIAQARAGGLSAASFTTAWTAMRFRFCYSPSSGILVRSASLSSNGRVATASSVAVGAGADVRARARAQSCLCDGAAALVEEAATPP